MARQPSDYTKAASAVVQNMDSAYNSSRSNSFDPGKVAMEIGNANAARYKAFIRTAGELAETKIENNSTIDQYKDTMKAAKSIKADQKRGKFAGQLAALGNTGIAYLNLKQQRKEDKALDDAEAARYDQMLTDIQNKLDEPKDTGPRYTPETLKEFERLGLKYVDGKLVMSSSGQPSTDSTDSKPITPDTGTTTETVKPQATSAEGFRGEVYNYLTQNKGLSKNKALGLMANIDRESSFRIAPPGGDNGNSFGMLQWNNNYGRSDLMKKNVPNWQSDWKGQLDHALSGNQLPEYNTVTQNFLNQTFESPQAAADYWMTNWERPADSKSGSAKHTTFLSGYNF